MLGAGVGNAVQQGWEGGNGLGDLAAMLSKGASVKKAAKVVRARAQVHHHKHFELVKTVTAGEWFGDWALLIDSLSDINVKAVTDVTLLILPVKTFREIREAWEKRNFAFRIEYLRGSPFGKYLDDENLCKLADALVPQRVPAGQYFIDAESTDFYILQSGVAIELKHHVASTGRTNSGGPGGRVASNERRGVSPTVPSRGQSPVGRSRRFKIPDSDPNKVREHRDGACFCHRNLSMQNLAARTWMLSEEPNNPIIVAGSDCTFLVLDRKSFIDLVGTYESLVERWTKGTLVRSDAEANLFAAGGAKSLRRAVGAGISPSSPILALSSQVRVLV
jgi:CRP-like cAMP-binding protein